MTFRILLLLLQYIHSIAIIIVKPLHEHRLERRLLLFLKIKPQQNAAYDQLYGNGTVKGPESVGS